MNYNEKKRNFDKILKELSPYDEKCFGYVTADGEIFDVYFENKIWNEFCKEMLKDEKAYNAYALGSGGELKEKLKSNKKSLPPKMASIASSSRFIYCTFKDKNYYNKLSLITNDLEKDGEFRFEDKLKIKNVSNATANLDASYKTLDRHIYVEAKCHELFNTHKILFSYAYLKGNALTGNYQYSLNIDEEYLIMNEMDVQVKGEAFGLSETERLFLNVKQFISHLLSIANTSVENKELIYLYFKPDKVIEFNEEYNILEQQFASFCKSKYISDFCKKNNILIKLVYSTNDSYELEFKPKIIQEYIYGSKE